MCVSFASSFRKKAFSGGCQPTMGGKRNERQKTGCACGMTDNWRKPNMLLVMQVGPGVQDQKVWLAYAAPQRLCENIVCALRTVTKSDCEQCFTRVTDVTKKQVAQALREFISADNDRARVCVGDLAEHKVPHWIVSRASTVKHIQIRMSNKGQMS